MIQPADRVLPSNASPLHIVSDSVQQACRILQEQPVNCRHSDPSFTFDDGSQKYQPSTQSENAWPTSINQLPQLQPHHFYDPQLRYGALPYHGLTHGRPTHSRFHHAVDNEQLITIKAKKLSERFQQSKGYVNYRERQQKDDNGKEEQKWPDHLEEAFFRALVKYPPMGRRQYMHKDKRRGRNELIADYILELTGEERDRKQVSSHIQVLKPFVQNDPQIMKYFSKADSSDSRHRHLSASHGSAHSSGQRASTYRTAASLPYPTRSAMASGQNQPDMETIRKLKHDLEMFRPSSFEMFVQRKYMRANGEQQEDRLHVYTKAIDEPLLADLEYHDWTRLHQDYPLLAAMISQKQVDCNIMIADASIGFPTEKFKDRAQNLPGVGHQESSQIELGISFVCRSQYLTPTARVRYRCSFYRGAQLQGKPFEDDAPIQLSEGENRGVNTSLKFGSSFWARILHFLSLKMQKNLAGPSRAVVDEVQSALAEITAVVEVLAVSSREEDPESLDIERLLIMCWTFRKSSVTTGRASWRRLVLPNRTVELSTEPLQPVVIDPFYQYPAETQYAEVPAITTELSHPPGLQSPFTYESSSNSASALSSATWPSSSLGDRSFEATAAAAAAAGGGMIIPDFTANTDNSFDFYGGSINLHYEQPLDFTIFDGSFDSAAFDFEALDSTIAQQPAYDPSLESFTASEHHPYRQQEQGQSQQLWYDGYGSHGVEMTKHAGANGVCDALTSQVEGAGPGLGAGARQQDYDEDGFAARFDLLQRPQSYAVGAEEGLTELQAYGGATGGTHEEKGFGRVEEEENALSALADASCLRSSEE